MSGGSSSGSTSFAGFRDDDIDLSLRSHTSDFYEPPPPPKQDINETGAANNRNHVEKRRSKDKKRCSMGKIFFNIIFPVMCMIVGIYVSTEPMKIAMQYMYPPPPRFPPDFVPLNITEHMPAARCHNVIIDSIIHPNDREKLALESLYYHMIHDNYESISAFHIGEPTCIVLLRLPNRDILELYNVEFHGMSIENAIRRDEYSSVCPNVKRHVSRASSVTVSYINRNSNTQYIEIFNGPQAWALQSAVLYSHGKTICTLGAWNTDEGINSLISDLKLEKIVPIHRSTE